jgi:DNA-binding NarL/FixJ family response regulator
MDNPIHFTTTELNIIRLTCEEQVPEDIAIKLGLPQATIEGMIKEIIKKMGVRNEIGILWYALSHNLWKLPER